MVGDKYAVYVVVVEDSEEEDMRLAMDTVSMERVEGNLDLDNAEELVDRLVVPSMGW